MTVQAGGLRGWVNGIRPEKGTIRDEAIAGLPGAIGSVPDGMAAALLTGVNPVFGLYASFAGPIAGGLSASTRLIVITTTSAAARALGATALTVLRGYAKQLDELGGRLFLSGVDRHVVGIIRRTRRAADERPFEVVEATPIAGSRPTLRPSRPWHGWRHAPADRWLKDAW